MPHKRLKFTFNYCKSNLLGFAIILALLFTMDALNNNAKQFQGYYRIILVLLATSILLLTQGYGLVITKDIIRNGTKLPKLRIKEAIGYGIKYSIVSFVYVVIQVCILDFIATNLNFPAFNLEESVANMGDIIGLFYTHNPIHTVLFIIISLIITYILTFFMEMAYARLADGGKLIDSLNIFSIKHCIDTIGWKHYTVDYSRIVLTIGVLSYLKYGIYLSALPNHTIDLVIGFVIFVVQFIGIGMVYRHYKVNEAKNDPIEIEIE